MGTDSPVIRIRSARIAGPRGVELVDQKSLYPSFSSWRRMEFGYAVDGRLQNRGALDQESWNT